MCNLSQGIKEEGIEIGRAEGEMMAFAKLIRAKKLTPKEVAVSPTDFQPVGLFEYNKFNLITNSALFE